MPASGAIAGLAGRLLEYHGPDDDPPPPEGGWTASVAVILRPAPTAPEILLIRRGERERDPWSGHMAFPGGRRDPRDRSLLETAIRETSEEIGLALDIEREMLGRLEPVAPLSKRLPALAILPFVFGVPAGARAFAESDEVASTHWVPLTHFRDPSTLSTHRVPIEGGILTFPAFSLEGRLVWGLTHRILEDLLERIP